MPRIKVTSNQWIELGTQLFSQKGIDGINVELMAKELDCNKSSFYWHFKNKANFLSKILDAWAQSEKAKVDRDAKDALAQIVDCIVNSPLKDFVFHLRKHSANDEAAGKVLASVERKWMTALGSALTTARNKKSAKDKAQVAYTYLTGWHELNKGKKMTSATTKKLLAAVEAVAKTK